MKRVISLFLTLMLVATAFPVSFVYADDAVTEIVASESLTGAGTDNNPYIISSAEDLKKANEIVNVNGQTGVTFSLEADIDYKNNEWVPLGVNGSFSGKFFGGNHVIKNLKITTLYPGANHGFFGRTGGYVSSLGIENMNVLLNPAASDPVRAGAFVGLAGGTITGCFVKNSSVRVLGPSLYGGVGTAVFAGTAGVANINNSYVYNATLCGAGAVACFVGKAENDGTSISNCYVAGITIDNTNGNGVREPQNIARFICKQKNTTVTNCYSDYSLYQASASIGDFVERTSTKAEIVAGLQSVFTEDKSVNDGYPCFSWEAWSGAASETLSGEGTAESPYLINNAADLKKVNDLINGTDAAYASMHYKLTDDINYMNSEWIPLGRTDARGFKGTFDGAGHLIKNLRITTPGPQYACNGFFGDMDSTTVVKNLGIENLTMNIYTGIQTAYIGTFAGRLGGTITNCYVKNSSLTNTGNIREWDAGAFAGSAWRNAKVSNCYAYNVSMSVKCVTPHGFVGKQDAAATYENCYAAEIQINSSVYGAFGRAANGTAVNCYSTLTSQGTTDDLESVTMGATKESVILAMVTSGKTKAYGKSDIFNDGYPSLTWEKWPEATKLEGAGTEESPYLIKNGPELKLASKMINEDTAMTGAARAHYKLAANIDYENREWIPIACENNFYGVFDGDNHTVKNLNITDSTLFTFGFFGTTEQTAVVKNLGIENFTIDVYIPAGTSSQENYGHRIGGMVAAGSGTFKNCFVKNSSLRNTNVRWYANEYGVGGFVGWLRRMSDISDCYAYNVKLCSYGHAGGFAGWVDTSTGTKVTNCYAASISRDTTGASGDLGAGNSATRSFMMKDTKTDVIVTNCYSDFNAAAEDDVLEKVYDKSEIIEGIVSNNSDTVFKASAMINDGYPSLKWEKIASFVESTVDGLDILEIPGGSKFFGQDFYDISIVGGDRVTADMGFAFVDDTAAGSNVNYIIEHDDITDVAETSNRGMMAVPKKTMARANESQFNALKASATSVTFKGASYKVTDFVDGYYIASTCEDINSALYWIKKDSVSDNALVSPAVSGIDYGSFFTVGINGTLTGVASNAVDTGVAFPLPTGGETKFAYQFTFAYPDNGGMYADGEGFTLWIDGMNFRIGTDGVYREDATFGTRVLDFGTNGTSAENLNKNSMVPSETIDIEHYFLATDAYSAKIGTLETMYQDNYWHNVMVLIDTESKYFTIYIDGLPVYFKAENGGYSCRYRLANDTVEEVTLITSASNVYNDHAPIFDNFLGYATFSSDAAIEESILQNLTLPYLDDIGFVIEGDFMLDENESNNVTWSFDSDALVIDEENPLLVRYNAPFGWGESTVKLTATSKYGTATKTRTFNLTVKDRQKYTVNTVLMKDASGNRIYRPLDNSVIESVSYTANVKEDAKMYLAIYDADGKLASCVTKPVADGVVTFNQDINANQTYKVFIWAANEMKLLAELKEDDYIESENPTIFSIGDSLAQTYGEGAKLQGWGERLHTIFEDNVTVDNTRSYGGRTCKWVHEEDSIKYILEKGKPGDYVFFMFGHNENKDDYRSSNLEVYGLFHRQIIRAAKAKGMIPVVVTPVARPWLDAGVARDSHGEYPETAMAAAEACGTPYIDIDALTRADLERLGSAAISQYYNPGDTHTVLAGADWVVGLIADELAKMNLPISQYLK